MPSADRGKVSSIPAPRFAVRAISASRATAVTLAGIVIVSAIVRTWAASKHAGPAYFPDEYLYTELSRSIATTGHAYVRGAPSHFAPLLAPRVTAPAWLFGSGSTGYHAAQAINAAFVSLAAVPVFALARTLRLGRPQALAAAALALALPGLLYTSFMLSEPIAYPLVLAAVADLEIARIRCQIGLTHIRSDALGEPVPYRFLHDYVNIIVGAAGLALNRVAELAAAGIVAGARRFGEAFGRHGILG